MLDQDFINKLFFEKIFKLKKINLDTLEAQLQDPYLNWIQGDPDRSKERAVFNKLLFHSERVLGVKNIYEQKKLIKTIIFNEVATCTALFPVLMYPSMEDYNEIRFYPFSNLTEKNLINYLKYIIKYDPIMHRTQITSEKSHLNAALLIQEYSISSIVFMALEEVALNLGIGQIKDATNLLRRDFINDIIKFIPKINNDGEIDKEKITKIDEIKILSKAIEEKKFLETN